MNLVERYDQFLHKCIFNPTAHALQRWLYINRYHLLFGSQLTELVLYVLMAVAIPVWMFVEGGSGDILICLIGGGFLWMRMRDGGVARYVRSLKEMANRSEEKGFSKPPTDLLLVAVRVRAERSWVNVMSTMCALLAPLALLHAGTKAIYLVTSLVFFTWSVTKIWTSHLWDVDNLDPRDREYLFGPKTQEQKIES